MASSRRRRLAVVAAAAALSTGVVVTGGAQAAQADDSGDISMGVFDYLSECDGEGNAGLNSRWDSYYCDGAHGGTSGPFYLYVHLLAEEVPRLDPVEITGQRPIEALPPATPVPPSSSIPITPGVVEVGPPERERNQLRCFLNNSTIAQPFSQTFGYTTSWQISSNVSGGAQGLLTAQLGVQFNVTTSNQYTANLTVPPGQGIGIFYEYEVHTYIVTSGNGLFGYTIESVQVRSPTDTVIAAPCR